MSHKVFKNATFSAAQTVVSAFLLFFLYRYLLQTLGAEQLGIWAIVLASTSVARLSDLGLSGAALRFVAKKLAVGKTEEAADVVQTASISIGAVLAILLVPAFPVLKHILASVIPAASMPQALSILPWAMLSLWFGLVASILQSALDGCSRMDLRNVILIICNILYLASAFWLVPNYGIQGLAKGQFAQSVALVLLSWLTLRKQMPSMPWIPYIWKKKLFKEMFGYALSFQISGLAAMLFDPVVKFFITKFGSLSDVAFYEMANQVILKVRGVLISAYQAIVPTIAGIQECDTNKLTDLYRKSYQIVNFIAAPYFMGVCIAFPLISALWIGHVEVKFITFGCILCIGWFLSSVGIPAYFHNIGTGNVNWNTATHTLTTALLPLTSYILGNLYGAIGVVIAAMTSLFLPNLINTLKVQDKYNISISEILPNTQRRLYLFILANTFLCVALYSIISEKISQPGISIIVLLIYTCIAMIVTWMHPLRSQILTKLRRGIHEI